MDPSISDAITAARRLFLHYKSSNHGRLDQQVRLTSLREQSWVGGTDKIGAIKAAERLLGIEIKVQEFPPFSADFDPILATLLRYDNKAKIFIAERENFCRQRFFIAKELCHLLMDNGEEDRFVHHTKDIIKLLSDLLLDEGIPPQETYPAYSSEMFAYWGACELLLPPEFTEKADEILTSGASNSLHQTALHFRVPKALVEQRFLNTKTRSLFDEAHDKHSYKTVDLQPVNLGPNRNK